MIGVLVFYDVLAMFQLYGSTSTFMMQNKTVRFYCYTLLVNISIFLSIFPYIVNSLFLLALIEAPPQYVIISFHITFWLCSLRRLYVWGPWRVVFLLSIHKVQIHWELHLVFPPCADTHSSGHSPLEHFEYQEVSEHDWETLSVLWMKIKCHSNVSLL